MKLITKQFSKLLIYDYLDFFDHRAFTDDNPNGPCYCTFAYQTKAEFEAMVRQFKDHDVKETIRKVAVEMLEAERIHGFLIFDDKLAIGWCNAANMDSYIGFVPPFARKAAIGKTLSIVCLEIAPEYRGQGVALALIKAICRFATKEGYDAVEGYPQVRTIRDDFDYVGPQRLYEKAGFTQVASQDGQLIMRKTLQFCAKPSQYAKITPID